MTRWKRISGVHVAGHPVHEFKMMRHDEDEKRFTVVPTGVPQEQPVQEPAKEPAREPVKEPEKVPEKVAGENMDISDKPKTINGEFLGYKRALVAKHDGQWKMHSPSQNHAWERGVSTAACAKGQHEAPGDNCMCGLYATWHEDDLPAEGYQDNEWTAQVKAWGEVLTGESRPRVMRAQHMQIIGIRPPTCEQCEKPSDWCISASEQNMGGRPVCDEHKPDEISGSDSPVHLRNVHDVAKELSDFYGGAKVVKRGEPWDSDRPDDMSDLEKSFKESTWKGERPAWSREAWVPAREGGSPFGRNSGG